MYMYICIYTDTIMCIHILLFPSRGLSVVAAARFVFDLLRTFPQTSLSRTTPLPPNAGALASVAVVVVVVIVGPRAGRKR